MKERFGVLTFLAAAWLQSSPGLAQQMQSTAPAESAAEKFDIYEYRVLGNSVLSAVEIEAAVYPFLGRGRDVTSAEQARQALERAYKDRGFGTVFVDIPEQDVGPDGVLRLNVTEGHLDRIRVTGARYFSNGRIREKVSALSRGTVPHLPTLQAELMKLNRESRDRSVTPVLRAGRTPGSVDVELKVQDEVPVHANMEVNDRYTADTSKTRASLNLSYDNLWQRNHSFSVQYQTAPEEPDEARVIAGTYVAPISSSGHMLALYAVDTNSDVATVGTLSVLGAGRIYGVRYIMPLPEAPGFFHNVSLGADYKDFAEGIKLTDGGTDQTPIDYVAWSAAYSGTILTKHTSSRFNLSGNLGLRGIGNDPDEFEFKRFNAAPNYFYLKADGDHERPLIFGTRLFVRFAAQFTTEPLISNEQFSIGGAESVRGYLESEELGDYGANGSVEWRTPSATSWFGGRISNLYLFSFYDAGVARLLDPILNAQDPSLSQPSRFELSSWGVGLRFAGFDGLEAAVDWAVPRRSTDRVEADDSRIHFQVRYGF